VNRRAFLSMVGATTALGRTKLDGAAQASPIGAYPQVERQARALADDRARTFSGTTLELRGRDGAYAPSLGGGLVSRPTDGSLAISHDGLLTFALDMPRDAWVSAELTLESSADVRPGLRASILCDTALVGAPMTGAAEWGIKEITDPAPKVAGVRPESRAALHPWLMRAGRRYLTIAAPHFRPGGTFASLTFHRLDRPVEPPLYQFAFISDTHLRRSGREDWMNRKMGEAAAPELRRTLESLATEGMAFVMHGGDMTEKATRDEFVLVRDLLAAQPLTVYGCIGNHDRYLPSSRPDALELLAPYFPGGTLDYTFMRPPLRFVVMDVAVEDEPVRAKKVQWLAETLAADRSTPTVFVWHYPVFNRGSVSSCGFRLQDWSELGRTTLLDLVRGAPNVIASINGHDHWDEVNVVDGLPFVQNAAFVEWPNTFRVYRVFSDRLEWEVRQVANRGFVRESFLPEKAMSWMIATRDGDLGGVIPFRRSG